MPTDALIQKHVRTLRRLLAGEGKPYAEIDELFTHGPRERLTQEWGRFQSMTKADRDRLFAAADARKRGRLHEDQGRTRNQDQDDARNQDQVTNPRRAYARPRVRGPGAVPAGVSFSLVIPPDLLDRLRQRAYADQRSVASILRLAAEAYLTPSRPE